MSREAVLAWGIVFLLFFLENFFYTLFPGLAFPLVLIAVVALSFKRGAWFGWMLGFWGGLLLEIFKTGPLGLAIVPMAVIGSASGFLSARIFRESFMAQIVIPVLAFYLFRVVHLRVLWEDFFIFEIPLTAVMSPLVFYCLKKTVDRAPSRRETRWER